MKVRYDGSTPLPRYLFPMPPAPQVAPAVPQVVPQHISVVPVVPVAMPPPSHPPPKFSVGDWVEHIHRSNMPLVVVCVLGYNTLGCTHVYKLRTRFILPPSAAPSGDKRMTRTQLDVNEAYEFLLRDASELPTPLISGPPPQNVRNFVNTFNITRDELHANPDHLIKRTRHF